MNPLPSSHGRLDPPALEPALEPAACPLCGESAGGFEGYRFPPYAVVRCRCGLWYLTPRLHEPAMRASYAEASYFEGEGLGYRSYLAQEATLRRTFRRFLRALKVRGMTGGRLLEVGCAYGFFLDEARHHFHYREGTDYSPTAAERARSRADRVDLGGLDAVPADEVFDCAALIHVIEHIYHPVAFLERLLEHVRPGGWVVLAAPDMGGFWRALMGRRWPFFKVPEHVAFYDRSSLARLLRQAGCARVEPLPYASYFSLDLIAEKLGRGVPDPVRSWSLRLPATTVAAAGQKA